MSKIKKKNKYKSRYKRKKYAAGGSMYSDNTVMAAGQGNIGTTANIVFEQNNPEILKSKLANLESTKKDIIASSKQTAQEIQQDKLGDEAAIQAAAAEGTQKANMIGSTIGSTLKAGQQMGIVDVGGNTLKGGLTDAMNAYRSAKAAKLAQQGAVGIKAGVQTQAQSIATQKSGELLGKVAASKAASTGIPATIAAPTTTAATAGTSAASAGTSAGVTAATETAKTGSSLGAGIASAAKNPNVLAAAANIGGKTIRYFSDDNDATTWTAGEATGDILGTAGEYAGYGAMLTSWLGPGAGIGAAVGGIIGAGVGIYKGITGRNKARKEERRRKRERAAKVAKYNKEVKEQIGSQLASTRSAEIAAKSTSGYDLGRNVVARRGGMRLGMPRYGFKTN